MPDATPHPEPTTVPEPTAPTPTPHPQPAPHSHPAAWAAPGAPAMAPGAAGLPQPWPPAGDTAHWPMPGTPSAAWPPPPHHGASAEQAPLPRTVARVSLILGIVGLVLAWVPILTWFAAAMLIAAVVLAIVAFASRRQGGAGFAAGGLATALAGLIVSLAMTVPSIMLLTGTFELNPYFPAMGEYDPEGYDYSEFEPEPAEALQLIEYSVGRHAAPADGWWYGVVVENPNWDWIYTTGIEVDALAADGTVLETARAWPTMANGRTTIAGTFTAVGDATVDRIEVRLPDLEDAELSYYGETGLVYIEEIESSEKDGATVVTGMLWGEFDGDARRVPLTAIAHGPDGRIIGATTSELGLLHGYAEEPTDFTITFPVRFPEGTTFEVFGSL